MSSQIFAMSGDIGADARTMASAPMGERTDGGRYKMPLLPGETGPKSVPRGKQPWVSGGLQSMTNLAASISDTRALGDWKLEQFQIGVGTHPELAQDLTRRVWRAREEGVDFQNLRAHPELRADLKAFAERAWDVGGANAARDAGIVRHDAWEAFGKTGASIGTEQINTEIRTLHQLLDAADFEIMPGLCERTVRNVALVAAGRFDNILSHRRTGKLYMADLKTKRKPFWTWLEMDAQLAGYAYAEWMLDRVLEAVQGEDGVFYVPGPVHHVDLTEGVILHMPSDGSEPRLRRADLAAGIETMRLARAVCTARSYGRSAGRERESWWPVS